PPLKSPQLAHGHGATKQGGIEGAGPNRVTRAQQRKSIHPDKRREHEHGRQRLRTALLSVGQLVADAQNAIAEEAPENQEVSQEVPHLQTTRQMNLAQQSRNQSLTAET